MSTYSALAPTRADSADDGIGGETGRMFRGAMREFRGSMERGREAMGMPNPDLSLPTLSTDIGVQAGEEPRPEPAFRPGAFNPWVGGFTPARVSIPPEVAAARASGARAPLPPRYQQLPGYYRENPDYQSAVARQRTVDRLVGVGVPQDLAELAADNPSVLDDVLRGTEGAGTQMTPLAVQMNARIRQLMEEEGLTLPEATTQTRMEYGQISPRASTAVDREPPHIAAARRNLPIYDRDLSEATAARRDAERAIPSRADLPVRDRYSEPALGRFRTDSLAATRGLQDFLAREADARARRDSVSAIVTGRQPAPRPTAGTSIQVDLELEEARAAFDAGPNTPERRQKYDAMVRAIRARHGGE